VYACMSCNDALVCQVAAVAEVHRRPDEPRTNGAILLHI
jgi:hypothetical protein